MQQFRDVVEQRRMMHPGGIGLLLHRSATPTLDEKLDVALEKKGNIRMRLGTNRI
jgi:hypothetical protein